jgi:hypothetical protein
MKSFVVLLRLTFTFIIVFVFGLVASSPHLPLTAADGPQS